MNYGKTCDRKQFYPTFGKAVDVAKKMSVKCNALILPYKCIACTGYHVGNAPEKEQKEFLAKRPRCRQCGEGLSLEKILDNSEFCGAECRSVNRAKKLEKKQKNREHKRQQRDSKFFHPSVGYGEAASTP